MFGLDYRKIDPSKITNVYSLLALYVVFVAGPFGSWLLFLATSVAERLIAGGLLGGLSFLFLRHTPRIIASAQPEKRTSQSSSPTTETPITPDELKQMVNDVGEIKRTTEEIRFDLRNPVRTPGRLSQLSPSDASEESREIDGAVKLLRAGNIEEAQSKLLKTLGKIEDKPQEFAYELARVYNNLGVCFNRPKAEGGDFDRAEEYFFKSLETKRYL